MADETKVADGQVVSMDYTLYVNGELVDASDEGEPLEFLQGKGNIIPGLEQALYGMKVGDSKKVMVTPGDGYGEMDPEAFIEVPSNQFPPDFPMQPGIELQLRNPSGEIAQARIDSVNGDMVRLDLNHPLAGKELQFDVTIAGLRLATEEELEHGHVHGDLEDDEYDEDEYDDEDFEEEGEEEEE